MRQKQADALRAGDTTGRAEGPACAPASPGVPRAVGHLPTPALCRPYPVPQGPVESSSCKIQPFENTTVTLTARVEDI